MADFGRKEGPLVPYTNQKPIKKRTKPTKNIMQIQKTKQQRSFLGAKDFFENPRPAWPRSSAGHLGSNVPLTKAPAGCRPFGFGSFSPTGVGRSSGSGVVVSCSGGLVLVVVATVVQRMPLLNFVERRDCSLISTWPQLGVALAVGLMLAVL